MLLTLHTDHAAYTLNGNFVIINGNTFNFYFDCPLYAYLHSLCLQFFDCFQYVFAYCKRSKTGSVEGLGMRLLFKPVLVVGG